MDLKIGDKVKIVKVISNYSQQVHRFKPFIGTNHIIGRVIGGEYPYVLHGVVGYWRAEELELIKEMTFTYKEALKLMLEGKEVQPIGGYFITNNYKMAWSCKNEMFLAYTSENEEIFGIVPDNYKTDKWRMYEPPAPPAKFEVGEFVLMDKYYYRVIHREWTPDSRIYKYIVNMSSNTEEERPAYERFLSKV